MFDTAERIAFRGYEIVILKDAGAHRDDLRTLEDDILRIATCSRGWDASHLERMRAIFKIYPLYLATSLALVFEGGALKGTAGCDTAFGAGAPAIVHLCSMNFSPEIQRNGLLSFLFPALIERVLELVRDGRDAIYFTSISQSPVVYSMLRKFSHLYPNWRETPPEDVARVARAVVAKYDPEVTFEERKLILRNECDFFYQTLPEAPDKRINDFIRSQLDIDKGDVFVSVGKSSAAQLLAYGERYRARFKWRSDDGATYRRPAVGGAAGGRTWS